MSKSTRDGGHDAKSAATKEKSSAGKAVGYSNDDPADVATGKDGLGKADAKTNEGEKAEGDKPG